MESKEQKAKREAAEKSTIADRISLLVAPPEEVNWDAEINRKQKSRRECLNDMTKTELETLENALLNRKPDQSASSMIVTAIYASIDARRLDA